MVSRYYLFLSSGKLDPIVGNFQSSLGKDCEGVSVTVDRSIFL